MDKDLGGQAQRAVGDTFQWRVLELERWREDHEVRLRKVETGVATMNERSIGIDKKLDDVLEIVRDNRQQAEKDTRGRLSGHFTVWVTVAAVLIAAILQHFWR